MTAAQAVASAPLDFCIFLLQILYLDNCRYFIYYYIVFSFLIFPNWCPKISKGFFFPS